MEGKSFTKPSYTMMDGKTEKLRSWRVNLEAGEIDKGGERNLLLKKKELKTNIGYKKS